MLNVPYKASSAALLALVAGEADVNFADPGSSQAQWRPGRVRGIGVTSLERMPLLPNIPTLREEGVPDFNMVAWFAVWVPAKTPSTVAATTRDIIRKAARSKSFSDVLTQLMMDPLDITPDQVNERTRREIEMWRKVVKEQNIKFTY
jgi:tripartite-type tricarboxylate transporter receptor subunit TctC